MNSVGHKGKFGHEFLEFELTENGELRYANDSRYRRESIIRKQLCVSPSVVAEFRRIINASGILESVPLSPQSHLISSLSLFFFVATPHRADDAKWPMPDENGKQELEIVSDDTHISFVTSKIGRMLDIQQSSDPDGLLKLHILSQNLRSFVLSLISLHFKVCFPLCTLSLVWGLFCLTYFVLSVATDQACWFRVSVGHCSSSSFLNSNSTRLFVLFFTVSAALWLSL